MIIIFNNTIHLFSSMKRFHFIIRIRFEFFDGGVIG